MKWELSKRCYLLLVGCASCGTVWWNKKNLIQKYLRLVLYPLVACVLQPRSKRKKVCGVFISVKPCRENQFVFPFLAPPANLSRTYFGCSLGWLCVSVCGSKARAERI